MSYIRTKDWEGGHRRTDYREWESDHTATILSVNETRNDRGGVRTVRIHRYYAVANKDNSLTSFRNPGCLDEDFKESQSRRHNPFFKISWRMQDFTESWVAGDPSAVNESRIKLIIFVLSIVALVFRQLHTPIQELLDTYGRTARAWRQRNW